MGVDGVGGMGWVVCEGKVDAHLPERAELDLRFGLEDAFEVEALAPARRRLSSSRQESRGRREST